MFHFQVGPFKYRIDSKIQNVTEAVELLYSDYPRLTDEDWTDFHVRIPATGRLWKRIFRPEARLFLDNFEPFKVFNQDKAGAILEWGMNWCLWLNLYHWLIFHAAMLEKNGRGLILAADSGGGKSTLAAGLAFRGWRLLSDELTLIDPRDTVSVGGTPVARMVPIPRPICLKNASIDVIREFVPEATFSNVYPETDKGRIAHVKLPRETVQKMNERVTPRWIVFPKYVPGAKPQWTPWLKAEALVRFGRFGRGYSILGETGFHTLANIIDQCDCWRFEYGNLEQAIEQIKQITE